MNSLIKFNQYKDKNEFIASTLQFIHSTIQNSIKERGVAVIGLSGGTTPRPVYEQLGKSKDIDWSKVYFFCVDERYIDKSSKDSIYDLIRNTIFSHIQSNDDPMLTRNFIHPETKLPLDECIAKYTRDLNQVLQLSQGSADLVTLGMGEDGHIASIFPSENGPSPLERLETVYHTTTTRFAVFDRITTNLITICQSRSKLFLMNGENKKKVWDEMVVTHENIARWPAQQVIKSGNTTVNYVQ
eukprot:gene9042-11075_t